MAQPQPDHMQWVEQQRIPGQQPPPTAPTTAPVAAPIGQPQQVYSQQASRISVFPNQLSLPMHVQTPYSDPRVLYLSRMVLQLASTILYLQIATGIITVATEAYYNYSETTDVLINFVVAIMLSVLLFYCAAKGVRDLDPPCCGSCTYLTTYKILCMLLMILQILYAFLYGSVGAFWGVVYSILFAVLYFRALTFTAALIPLLKEHRRLQEGGGAQPPYVPQVVTAAPAQPGSTQAPYAQPQYVQPQYPQQPIQYREEGSTMV